MTVSPDFIELLEISGPDAVVFAHAQFASDVTGLAVECWQWSAWLNAQGRVRHVFLLLRPDPERLLAWLPLGGAAVMRSDLARFVFRAKVALGALPGWGLHPVDPAEAPAGADHRIRQAAEGCVLTLPGKPPRVALLAPGAGSLDAAALARWRLEDIASGLPWLAPEVSAEFVPQALDLDRLGAVSYRKGCFPGQEIAARLHFRGGNKRLPCRLRLAEGALPPAPGSRVEGPGGPVGRVLYAAGLPGHAAEALAVLSEADWKGAELRVGEDRVVALLRDFIAKNL